VNIKYFAIRFPRIPTIEHSIISWIYDVYIQDTEYTGWNIPLYYSYSTWDSDRESLTDADIVQCETFLASLSVPGDMTMGKDLLAKHISNGVKLTIVEAKSITDAINIASDDWPF